MYNRPVKKLLKDYLMLIGLPFLNSCELTAEINLAENKNYTISPKPNYPYCTDAANKQIKLGLYSGGMQRYNGFTA